MFSVVVVVKNSFVYHHCDICDQGVLDVSGGSGGFAGPTTEELSGGMATSPILYSIHLHTVFCIVSICIPLSVPSLISIGGGGGGRIAMYAESVSQMVGYLLHVHIYILLYILRCIFHVPIFNYMILTNIIVKAW